VSLDESLVINAEAVGFICGGVAVGCGDLGDSVRTAGKVGKRSASDCVTDESLLFLRQVG
jgi:hypothetical protein